MIASGLPARAAPWRLARWLPASLAGRVFLLYLLSWMFCVGVGLVVFYGTQLEEKIETAHRTAQSLADVTGQTVLESAVIGDYDTIKRILDTATHDSVFRQAKYIDLLGGRVSSESVPASGGMTDPPAWLRSVVAARLHEVNRNIVAGGRDYGVLRLNFDADGIARQFWVFTLSAALIGSSSFLGGLVIIWWPLRRWLAPLQHSSAEQPGQAGAAGPVSVDPALIAGAPEEFRGTLLTLSATAGRLRAELAARETVLEKMKGILATLHPGGAAADSSDLGELTATLSGVVRERETMRHDLAEAVEAAETANRTKSAFLATMSHELRTPLNGILGMAQLLHLGVTDEATRRTYSGIIHASGTALLMLLNDILDLSKIEAGKLELANAAFNPASLLADAVTMFAPTAAAKGIELRVAPLALRDPAYGGDPARLAQMLANLVNNAIKFTERGVVTLSCAEAAAPAGRALEFSVADTGVGIPADKLGRLFQRFSQVDDTNTRRAGGSGLGLSIVRGFAELMGGRIGVESRLGAGSRFWFRIPARAPGSPATGLAHQPSGLGIEQQVPMRFRGRALVADDSLANRMVAERLLERLGLEVVSAPDGREAVAMAGNGSSLDLILMDIQMPEMDGIEATLAIRGHEAATRRRRTPIVALTAAAYASDHARCLAAGMDGHLAKPILLRPLTEELAKWLPAETKA